MTLRARFMCLTRWNCFFGGSKLISQRQESQLSTSVETWKPRGTKTLKVFWTQRRFADPEGLGRQLVISMFNLGVECTISSCIKWLALWDRIGKVTLPIIKLLSGDGKDPYNRKTSQVRTQLIVPIHLPTFFLFGIYGICKSWGRPDGLPIGLFHGVEHRYGGTAKKDSSAVIPSPNILGMREWQVDQCQESWYRSSLFK